MLDIAEKQQVRIDIDALAARLGCPVIPLVSTRGRGIEALKIALDRHQANSDLELVHYPQPLLREADLLAQQMSAQIPPRQRRWLGLQMLEGDIYSRAYMPATPPINWISPWRISATRSTTRRCTSLTRAIRPSPPFATPSAIP